MDAIVVYSGTGTQRAGMGEKYYNHFDVVKETFDEVSNISGISVADICYGNQTELIYKPGYAQLVLFTYQVAMYKLLNQELGYVQQLGAGYSIGNISAMYNGGVIDIETAIELVKLRRSSTEMLPSEKWATSLVHGIKTSDIEGMIDNDTAVHISSYHDKNTCLVTGVMKGIDAFEKKLREAGHRMIMRMPVGIPAHTHYMKSVSDFIQSEYIPSLKIKKSAEILSNINGLIVEDYGSEIVNMLSSPVRWDLMMDNILKSPVDTIVSIGPGRDLNNGLTRFFKKQGINKSIFHIDKLL